MAVAPQDMLALSEQLAQSPAECDQRAATGRAYYAAYHHCLDWHTALPFPGANAGPPGGKHQQLINRLRNPDPGVPAPDRKRSKLAGMKLDVLRVRRVVADYKLQETPAATEAADQIAQAKAVIAGL